MIKHTVFWKLKDENKEQNMQKIKHDLEALVGKVDGLLSADVGMNFAGGEYDLALVSDFESKEALNAYQTHPLHMKVREFVGSVKVSREAVDFEY